MNGMGYDETVDILGAIAKLDYFWELFLKIIGLFLKVKYRIEIFVGLLTYNDFGVMLDFYYKYFFWGGGDGVNSGCLVQVYVVRKDEGVGRL